MLVMDILQDPDGEVAVRFNPENTESVSVLRNSLKPEFLDALRPAFQDSLKGYEIQNPLVTFANRYEGDYYKDLSEDYVQTDAWVCDVLGEFWKESEDSPGHSKQGVLAVLTRLIKAYLREHEELLALRE